MHVHEKVVAYVSNASVCRACDDTIIHALPYAVYRLLVYSHTSIVRQRLIGASVNSGLAFPQRGVRDCRMRSPGMYTCIREVRSPELQSTGSGGCIRDVRSSGVVFANYGVRDYRVRSSGMYFSATIFIDRVTDVPLKLTID